MKKKSLKDWLNRSFPDHGYVPDDLEALSAADRRIAGKIRNCCERAQERENYGGVYLQALEGTERFYELTIRALSALIRIGQLGSEVKNVRSLCRNTLKIFSHELEFEHCSIMLKDGSGDYLTLIAGTGKGDRYVMPRKRVRNRKMKLGQGIAGEVAQSGEPVIISDVSKDSRFLHMTKSVAVSSLLSVPLRSDDEVIGVINFSHPLAGAFDENNINLMMLLSNFVGQMIRLTELHEKLANWNEYLKKEVDEKTAELRKKNRELEKAAVRDSLTGVFNRRFFATRLEEEFSRATRYGEEFSLLVIDLDNLKTINDTYGHPVGDRVIIEVAKVLRKLGRKGDVIARIGGDEFGCLLIDADRKDADSFASRIKKNLRTFKYRGAVLEPSVSIGLAHSVMKKYKEHQDMYKAADDALYAEKRKKKIR